MLAVILTRVKQKILFYNDWITFEWKHNWTAALEYLQEKISEK